MIAGSAVVRKINPIGMATANPIETGMASGQWAFVMAPGQVMAFPRSAEIAVIATASSGPNKMAKIGTITRPPPKPE